MSNKKTIKAVAGPLCAIVFLIAGCSSNSEQDGKTFAAEVIDSVAASTAEAFANAAQDPVTEVQPVESLLSAEPISASADMAVSETTLYAVLGSEVIVYDFSEKTHDLIPVEGELQSVTIHQGDVYVGGRYLYRLNGPVPERYDGEFGGTITNLYSYGDQLLAGTTHGLYSESILGWNLVLDDVSVSALAADESGLWIGTSGQGLYRWDGDEIRKRYLRRDQTLFDTVNVLQFEHRHLYVGGSNGLHIFDGGSWETLTSADGLPSNHVRTIDATSWIVYVGTDEGVVSLYEGEIKPVEKLADERVESILRRGRKLIAMTEAGDILLKSGPVLTTLIKPQVEQETGSRAQIP